jgi:hypothetical protein
MPDKKGKSEQPKRSAKARDLDDKSLDKVSGGSLRSPVSKKVSVVRSTTGRSVYSDPCDGGE